MIVVLQRLQQRITQEKHSGHAEFIAKFCLVQFNSGVGESKSCVVANSVPVLCTELQWGLSCFYDRKSSVAESPCVHPVPTDLPQLRLWLIFWVRMNENSSLEDRYYFFFLGTKMSFGFRHKTFWGELCASGNFFVSWSGGRCKLCCWEKVELNSPWSYGSQLLASQHLSYLQMTTENTNFENFRSF